MWKQWRLWQTILGGSKITADGDCSHEIKRRLLLGRTIMTNLDNILKSRDVTLSTKYGWQSYVFWLSSQSYSFSVVMYAMWVLDYKESWAPKNWCLWTVMLEKTLESPLDSKEIQPVNPKGNQSWIFIGMMDAETETPILWPPDSRNWLIWIDSDAGKDWSGGEGDDRGWHSWKTLPT